MSRKVVMTLIENKSRENHINWFDSAQERHVDAPMQKN
jgi:hypothetical protein